MYNTFIQNVRMSRLEKQPCHNEMASITMSAKASTNRMIWDVLERQKQRLMRRIDKDVARF
jgi:hypothetical protein